MPGECDSEPLSQAHDELRMPLRAASMVGPFCALENPEAETNGAPACGVCLSWRFFVFLAPQSGRGLLYSTTLRAGWGAARNSAVGSHSEFGLRVSVFATPFCGLGVLLFNHGFLHLFEVKPFRAASPKCGRRKSGINLIRLRLPRHCESDEIVGSRAGHPCFWFLRFDLHHPPWKWRAKPHFLLIQILISTPLPR